MYMRYMHVLCSYMHVFPAITPKDTGNDATSPKHSLQGQQSAGHTQGTPGHLSIHFFFALGKCCSDPIWRTPPRCTRPGPLKRPCRWPLGGLQCTIRALQSSPVACHSRSEPIQTPEGAGRHPSKIPPNCNSPMSVYVSICMYMYVHTVYVCKPMYMYVYMNLPKSMLVYVFICMYMHICTYNSEYVRICMYMRTCTYIFSKGLYTLKMDVGITAILAQWQRSSPFTVETGVRDLKTRKAFCIILNTFFRLNFRNGLPLMSSDFLVVP